MPRLGAKYTVEGYLDDVARRSFILTTESGPENFRAFVEQLKQGWEIEEFVALFEEIFLPFGWSYKVENGKSALGRRTQIQVFLPSVSQILSTGRPDSSGWSEKVLTAHSWSISVRKGKAKLDVIPTSLFISEHALRRLYERSGGCSYDEFPQLTAAFFQEVLEKTDTLMREFVFVETGVGKFGTAVPTTGGLAVVNWNLLFIKQDDPNLGMLIKVKNKYFLRSVGSFNAAEFWNIPIIDEAPGYEPIPSYFVRTFYSDEEISDVRRESCVLLDVLLNNVQKSAISPSNLLLSMKNPAGRRIISKEQISIPQATPGLRADVTESLNWLKYEDSGAFLLAPYEKNSKIVKSIINNVNIVKKL